VNRACGRMQLANHNIFFEAGPALSLFFVRPAGRTHLRVKVPYDPGRGIVSRTARVSTVRWNLKEAAGKTLVQLTETA
jgi:hypothetical protein